MKIHTLLATLALCVSAVAAAEPEAPPADAPAQGISAPAAGTPAVPGEAAGGSGRDLAAASMRAVDWAASRTQDLLATALASIGVKYRRGASDPAVGFDCSGFVRHVYKEAIGLLLPHNAYSMSLQGKPVALSELQPGDLVFFNTLKKQFSHVGIYLGDDRFIHAPSRGKSVEVDKLSDSYWARHFTGARRVDPEALSTSATPQE